MGEDRKNWRPLLNKVVRHCPCLLLWNAYSDFLGLCADCAVTPFRKQSLDILTEESKTNAGKSESYISNHVSDVTAGPQITFFNLHCTLHSDTQVTVCKRNIWGDQSTKE